MTWTCYLIHTHTLIWTCISPCEQDSLTHDLWQGVALQVQEDASCLQAGPQLKQTMEGQCRHVWLAPSLPSLLHLLLKLHPPAETQVSAPASEEIRQGDWYFEVIKGCQTGGCGFNKGTNAVSLVNPWCSSCLNNYLTF